MIRSAQTVWDGALMKPYSPPAGDSSPGTLEPGFRWALRTRLKLFIRFACASLVLTFGLFHAFFIICFGDPEPLGTQVVHRYLMAIIGLGLPIQVLLSAFALSHRLGWTMVIGNYFVLGLQFVCVCGIILAVLSGP